MTYSHITERTDLTHKEVADMQAAWFRSYIEGTLCWYVAWEELGDAINSVMNDYYRVFQLENPPLKKCGCYCIDGTKA